MNPRTPAYSASKEDIDAFFTGAAAVEIIAVDTETTVGGDVRDGRDYAMGVSVAYRLPGLGLVSNYFPFRHRKDSPNLGKDILAQLKELIENVPVVVFHNAKFDLVSLKTLGIDYQGKFYDTMLMAHMINENIPFTGKSLDSCTKHYLNDPGKKKSEEFQGFIKVYGWNKIPSFLMHEYASYDADLTLRLFEHLQLEWDVQELEQLWDVEQKFVRLLIEMEGQGVRINQALVDGELDRGQRRMAEITEQLGLNPASPKDLNKLLIEELSLPIVKYTDGSYEDKARTQLKPENERKPSFDKQAMVEYEALLATMDDDRASLILEYRGYQKTISSNYKPYRELLSPDGRLRPNYKVHGTVTGRMSCEKPNLQQIPRVSDKPWNGSLKQAFIAEPGFTLWEADYSQLELRLAAAYAREETLLEVFNSGRDIFTEMAAIANMSRHDVKTRTYTIQYGGGGRRLAAVFGVSLEEGMRIRDEFFEQYPGFQRMSRNAASKCRQQGFLRYWSNRRRHFIDPQNEAHKAFNSVIQGGAAEIVKHTMLRVSEVANNDDCRMLLQVHDSIVFEIRNGHEDRYCPLIQQTMENVEPDFGVKFAVDIHKWGTEEAWNPGQSQIALQSTAT
jgi:DNA polymerase I